MRILSNLITQLLAQKLHIEVVREIFDVYFMRIKWIFAVVYIFDLNI